MAVMAASLSQPDRRWLSASSAFRMIFMAQNLAWVSSMVFEWGCVGACWKKHAHFPGVSAGCGSMARVECKLYQSEYPLIPSQHLSLIGQKCGRSIEIPQRKEEKFFSSENQCAKIPTSSFTHNLWFLSVEERKILGRCCLCGRCFRPTVRKPCAIWFALDALEVQEGGWGTAGVYSPSVATA
eukprot:1161501-Pelagomonas_calceolata.AAC.1